jgi:hypothetical protein
MNCVSGQGNRLSGTLGQEGDMSQDTWTTGCAFSTQTQDKDAALLVSLGHQPERPLLVNSSLCQELLSLTVH